MIRFRLCAVGAIALLTFGCGGATSSVTIDGSSTVFPISQAVAEEFGNANKDIKVTVGSSGTGGGFKKFTAGDTDISDASRPINAQEWDAAKTNKVEFYELPIAYDGLSIVVSKQNTFVDKLTVEELTKLFEANSQIKKWKQLRPDYPDEPIRIFMPGTDSGTFDYFKEAVVGKDGNIRGDEIVQTSEDDNNLVKGVADQKNAVGFFGCSYYFENMDTLRAIPIINSDGNAILPTKETIESGEYNPFSRPLFIYVNKKSYDEKPQVKDFIKFYLDEGPGLGTEVGYVRLPKEVYDRVRKNLEAGKTGSQCSGKHGPLASLYL